MATTHEYSFCTICGMQLEENDFRDFRFGPSYWNHSMWLSSAMVISGPYWPTYHAGPVSLDVPDEFVTRRLAIAKYRSTELTVIPNGEAVTPQVEESPDDDNISFGIHVACDAIATCVIETSPTARIRSIGDLWVTLERRCTKTDQDQPFFFQSFLPNIPENNPTEPHKLGLSRYYVPPECFEEDPPPGWWNHDPLLVPDLTAKLLSNLEQVDASSSPFAANFASLPPEVRDMIDPLVLRVPVNIECNYRMPQAYWKEIFFQIPFLWDLDKEVIASKLSTDLAGKEWNWEKITRQVLSPPKVAALSEDEISHEPWDYKEVGLLVPDGLTNRRRIWQICEDMYPNDVGMVHDTHATAPSPDDDIGIIALDDEVSSDELEYQDHEFGMLMTT
ncbi:hypothetical protein B0T10DRAFT_585112 [Thelonectria olida]|uniref:Uncharacterized protein n=1 Tax=Thelonectria olida TaxID=1576542 RepID=A0A9P8VTA8_9HYPO|nr:hypothetical protein B0T10DRAFT_585112 [Thelonectria olida]